MPLRTAISGLDRPVLRASARADLGLPADAPVLLVYGGSQGARSINAAVADGLAVILDAGVAVLHAVGAKNDLPSPRVGYHPVPYLDRMDLAYAAADLVVCRAGAMTCAELAAVGLPAVFVPLPIGNGEQALNARPLVDAGAGLLVADADLDPAYIVEVVLPLLNDHLRISEMGAAAAGLGHRDADELLADLVMEAIRR